MNKIRRQREDMESVVLDCGIGLSPTVNTAEINKLSPCASYFHVVSNTYFLNSNKLITKVKI